MAKTAGLGDNFYFNGIDLSGDVGSLSRIGGGPALLDVTAIKSSGFERTGAKRDGAIEYSSWFNPYSAATPTGPWLLSTDDRIGTYFRGTVIGNDGASCIAKQVNWDGTRADDGALSFVSSLQSNATGVEWGLQHTAGKQLDAAPTDSSGMDYGAVGLSFGAQAYIHVFSVSGTSVVIHLQDFTTDTPASYADITGLVTGAITPAMCPYAVRLATANNALIRRWTRVKTTGTFTNCTFAVLFCRNPVADMVF